MALPWRYSRSLEKESEKLWRKILQSLTYKYGGHRGNFRVSVNPRNTKASREPPGKVREAAPMIMLISFPQHG
jgi:hypothetical protein